MKTLSLFSLCVMLIVIVAIPVLSAEYRTHLFGWVSIDYGGMGIAINNQNLALCVTASSNDSKSFLWQKDAGITYITDPSSFERAYALNNLGYVAGAGPYDTAVVRHPGGYSEVLPRPAEAVHPFAAAAKGINDAGQVVGNVGGYAVFWDTNRTYTIFGSNVSVFAGINASGQTAWTDFSNQSYLWSQSAGNVNIAPVPGQTTSTVLGLNDSGLVVGISGGSAVLWRTPGSPQQLPLLAGMSTASAQGINNAEQIVGEMNGRAVLWDTSGSMVDLSQYVGPCDYSVAYGINDNGWIVGTVWAPGGMFAAVWEPVPVPEPSSMLTLASGVACLVPLLRRRRS